MFNLYIKSNSIKFIDIIYLTFFFSFFMSANSDTRLEKLNLPAGFEISIYSNQLESPRQITETKAGFVIVGSKNGDKIFALFDRDKDGFVDEKILIASDLKNPTGVTFHEKDLYFAEIERVWVIKDIDSWLLSDRNSSPKVELFLDNLPSETWHGFRHIRFGPDNNLYIPIGVPCNVCIEPQTNDERFAAIHKYEDSKLIMVADGVRNSVGIDWHPVTNKLYFSDNGRDWLGDDSPSCELNRVDFDGQFFGYPFKHASNVVDPEFGHINPGYDFVDPILELGAHVAPTGVSFYNADMFPAKMKNNLFIVLHGSWNRTEKVGYKIIRVEIDEYGNATKSTDFISGWLKDGKVSGRPSAPLVRKDGALLISDDKANVIYQVTYQNY